MKRHLIQYIEQRLRNRWETTTTTNPFEPIKLSSQPTAGVRLLTSLSIMWENVEPKPFCWAKTILLRQTGMFFESCSSNWMMTLSFITLGKAFRIWHPQIHTRAQIAATHTHGAPIVEMCTYYSKSNSNQILSSKAEDQDFFLTYSPYYYYYAYANAIGNPDYKNEWIFFKLQVKTKSKLLFISYNILKDFGFF
jgi:hypothetical protein